MILTHVDLIEKLLKYVPAADCDGTMRRQNAEMQRHKR
jgi:hypothetical protein